MPDNGVEDCEVIICGCGPTGALLSALLGRLRVKHIVLERAQEITTDPRGIVLDEDGIRIAQGVGIYSNLFEDVGSAMRIFRFIQGGRGLQVKPFLQFDYRTIEGGTGHVGFMCHKQPSLEKHLRKAVDEQYGEIRSGCTVVAISEDTESVCVEYDDVQKRSHKLRGKFLVGADGKTGFVRKKYLEPRGILMEKSPKFRYEAVWVALNWRLTLPTPASHPGFPLWKLGYTPEEVYDLFFPQDFNFICDPSRPAVCGRFGRKEDRLWRFEFVVKDGEDGSFMATQKEAGKIIFPYLTHKGSRYRLSHDLMWPSDCIEWIRSRPFSFSARSCNKWSLNRTILCGDAAHVFPPFGGQGIASGFRDAISLSWRLKVATDPQNVNIDHEALLQAWFVERKQQLERSLASTVENGNFCNEPSRLKAFLRNWYLWIVQLVPSWKHKLQLGGRREGMTKYDWELGLPFLPRFGGGKSFPQVFSAPIDGPAPPIPEFTDDAIFASHKSAIFQLVAILNSVGDIPEAQEELKHISLSETNLTLLDLSEATFIVHNTSAHSTSAVYSSVKSPTGSIIRVIDAAEYTVAGQTPLALAAQFPRPEPLFYDPDRIRRDLGWDKRYVLVRWDRFVFASCRNVEELREVISAIGGCFPMRKNECL